MHCDPRDGLVGLLEQVLCHWCLDLGVPQPFCQGRALRQVAVALALRKPRSTLGRHSPHHRLTGLTLLHLCAARGDFDLVQQLLEGGHRVDVQSQRPHEGYTNGEWWLTYLSPYCRGQHAQPLAQQETPLHHAAARNQWYVVRLLVSHLAQVQARTALDRRLPYEWAPEGRTRNWLFWAHADVVKSPSSIMHVRPGQEDHYVAQFLE